MSIIDTHRRKKSKKGPDNRVAAVLCPECSTLQYIRHRTRDDRYELACGHFRAADMSKNEDKQIEALFDTPLPKRKKNSE